MDPDPAPVTSGAPDEGADLGAVAADLADVETAMRRIEDGTYWTDEVTGEPLDDALLADQPTARRQRPTTSGPPPAGDPPPSSGT